MTEQEIFIGAFERTNAEERTRFLDEACGNDPRLRARIEHLLQLAATPDARLDAPIVPQLPADLTPDSVFANRYRLIAPFGVGAMGVVWQAEQLEPVRREVALKILHPEHDAGPVLARFEAERHLLGRMDHPNIATIFDAGITAEGRRFFAMEAIRGPSIAQFCNAKNLGTDARIRLFVSVCRAIQHAHQKGVIHRDIKPGNILIADAEGAAIAKVIDFGVAKSVDPKLPRDRLTGHGAIVGTPQYMSPEQAELNNPDVDTRSDVYSLGAVLYELLTSNPPVPPSSLDSSPLVDVLRTVREVMPPLPSAVRPFWDTLSASRWRELDAIVLMCLAKDREQRYPSAESLADDLTRFLAHEPVQACLPSSWYPVVKFIRRHRGGVAWALISALLLVGGSIGTAIGFVRANRAATEEANQRATAERERDDKDRAACEAESHLRTARRALFHLNQVATEYSFEPRMETTWRNLLRDSSQFYQELADARPNEPELLEEMGKTIARMGMAYRRIGDTKEAIRAFERAIAMMEKLNRESALTPASRVLLAQTYQHLGWELSAANRRPERVMAHRQALAHAEQLFAELPEPRHRNLVADCYSVLGTTLVPTKPEESEQLFLRAIQLLNFPDATQHHLGTAWLALGELQRDKPHGRPDAEKSLRRAIEVLAQAAAKHATAWQTRDRLADARTHLGRVLLAEGRVDEALTELRTAVTLREMQMQDFAKVPTYRDDLFGTRVQLIRVLATTGKLDEARAEFEKLAVHTPDTPTAWTALAWLYAGYPDASFHNPKRAIELAERAMARAPEIASHQRALGAAQYRSKNYVQSIEAFTNALRRRSHGDGSERLYLAMSHAQSGDRDAARNWYAEAIAWIDQHAPKDAELARLRREAEATLGLAP